MVQELVYKIVVVGDAAVGKSNIMMQYTTGEFNQESMTTIGVEYQNKVIRLGGGGAPVDPSAVVMIPEVKLQIWDTAGQERFRAISRSIYHGARGMMIVYDITKEATFEHVPSWLEEVRTLLPPNTPIFLLGNKCDLEDDRHVKTEVANNFAKEHGMIFLETSAKNRTNIEKAFEWLAQKIFETSNVPSAEDYNNINNNNSSNRSNTNATRVAPQPQTVNLRENDEKNKENNKEGGGKCGKC
jgi:Ras-related protein Rab-11A